MFYVHFSILIIAAAFAGRNSAYGFTHISSFSTLQPTLRTSPYLLNPAFSVGISVRKQTRSAIVSGDSSSNDKSLSSISSFAVAPATSSSALDNAYTMERAIEDDSRQRKLNFNGFVSRVSDVITKSKLWGLYSLSLSLRPIYTKSLSSLIGFLIGDLLAQVFFIRGAFDLIRFLRMGAFGAFIHAPLGHLFYGFLEQKLPGIEVSAIAAKLAIDQIVWTPMFGSLLFSFVGITAGHSPSLIFRTIKNNLLKIVLTSWMIWPLAHTINFKYVTPKHRLLYINSVQIVYNICLSVFSRV